MAKAVSVPAAALLVLLACCSCCGVRGEVAREVRVSLVNFLTVLAGGDGGQAASRLGWNAAVDPCRAGSNDSRWGKTVTCFDSRSEYDGLVKKIELGGQGLSGTIDAALLCAAPAIRVLDVHDNSLRGGIPAAISACSNLTHLVVGGNQLSGSLPPVLAGFKDLHVIDVSRNNLSGELPGELSKLVLKRFLANDNHFIGRIPDFNLSKDVEKFSVSNNNLTGPIPKNVVGEFRNQRFWLPNADGICGQPVFPRCQSSQSPSPQPSSSDSEADKDGQSKSRRGKRSARKIAMYIGFALLGAVILALVLYLCLRKRRKNKPERKFKLGGGRRVSDSSKATTTTPTTPRKSVYSLPTSAEQSSAAAAAGTPSAPSTSLVVLRRSGTASITTPAAAAAAKELRFEDLLKSPAELLGRGRFGSSYKVVVPGGAALVVKRVKDAEVGEDEFRRRMERVGRARHLAVLPPLAFYCAMQEKLVLYEFQSNGSLARLLHGSIESSHGPVDWPTRLHIAAKVADGMAFMHAALRGDGTNTSTPDFNSSSGEAAASAAADGPIAHGSLKTSNILFTNGMDPCISEYGVTAPHLPTTDGSAALQADVRAFGVVLLELLTGKATVAQGDGAELARWVAAVIREEWTAEVFDRALLDGSSEQRMVRLLQVAMRCVDASPGAAAPPTMREVASMINAIREEDDRSLSSEA